MTKVFVFTLFVTLILTSCKTEKKAEQTDERQDLLKYDTAKIAIISWDKNSRFPFDSVSYKATTLTQEDLGQMDSLVTVCVTDYNKSLTDGHDDFKIDLKNKNYKKQLIAVTNAKGEKEVWVNCFCDDWDRKWQTEILSVHDGGPCYFNLKINLTTKKMYELGVNGFA